MTEIETQKPKSDQDKKQMTNRKIVAFALEFGFMIAVPLLILALLGKWLAERYGNMGFFYGGVVLALIISFAWFWKRITDIYNDFIN